MPAKHYIAMKQEEVEEGEPKAESLKELASKDDGDSDSVAAELRQARAQGRSDARLAEELRSKLKLLGHCHVFLWLNTATALG